MITQSELKEMLRYNPETGLFTYKFGRGKKKSGSVVGFNCNGYTHITFGGDSLKAHRLAWLYMTGSFPKEQIDHINGVRNDNRFCNLREATGSQNSINTGKRKRNSLVFLLDY